MGLEVDPDFADNRRIYTCPGGVTGGGHDVHVIAWTLDDKPRKATTDKVAGRRLPDQLAAATAAAGCSSPATARCSSAPATPRIGHQPARTSTRWAARRCG